MRTYLRQISGLALESQRTRWAAVVDWLRWCVRRGHLKTNPAELLDPSEKPWVGKRAQRLRGRGKPQLRNLGEVRAYVAAALALSTAARRVAALLPLLDGMRSGEVRHLQVGGVDLAAGRIRIRRQETDEEEDGWDVKTASSWRTVGLPAVLRTDLEALCQGRGPTDLVIQSPRTGRAMCESWLNDLVHHVCRTAGVRVICAHGLRDTYASMHADHGRGDVEIAELMGHGDDGAVARRHYIGAPEHTKALSLENETP